MVTLRKWQALTWAEQRLLAEALLLLPLLNVGLHLFGLRRLQQLLLFFTGSSTMPAHQTPTTAQAQQIRQLARLVTMAAHHGPYRATCLRRALLLWWWLRRAAIEAQVQIGARFVTGNLQAHAWVEVDGCPVGEDECVQQHYAVFPKLNTLGI